MREETRERGKAYLRGVVEEATGGGGEHNLLRRLAFVGGVVLQWRWRKEGRGKEEGRRAVRSRAQRTANGGNQVQ